MQPVTLQRHTTHNTPASTNISGMGPLLEQANGKPEAMVYIDR
jgi:hypothetical protein